MAMPAERVSSQNQLRLRQLFTNREFRLSNLYWIQNEQGDRVKFVMNEVQRYLDNYLWWLNLILKSRQHGITTWALIQALDIAIFTPNSRCGIVAHTREDAEKFFRHKIMYALDKLPDWVHDLVPVVRRDMNGSLEFANGSSIEVSVSHRGGTFQFLHISEYGPMCAMYPERANEVKAGALNTVHKGGIVTIESTAKGREGDFFDRCKRAMALNQRLLSGKTNLTRMDYRFFFFAWFDDPKNCLDSPIHINEEYDKYFNHLQDVNGIKLRPEQKYWYIKKDEDQGDKMKQEHPSTPEEAFEASNEACYYAKQMSVMRRQGRICRIPIIQSEPVNTFWDLGRNDSNAIWLHQHIGQEHRFIAYYQNSGPGIGHYAKWLIDFAQKHEIVYGMHYLPHDAGVIELTRSDNKTRAEVLHDLGIKPQIIVDRIENLQEGIDMVRQVFPGCWIDEDRCQQGIEALDKYQKRWNNQVQAFQDEPLKNDARNGADAFRQFAQGYFADREPPKRRSKRRPGSWKTR